MKLDILAIAAHPDDIELSVAGTLLKHIKMGLKCGIVDITKGELGTRGSGDLRILEATAAAEVLGLSARENLELPDGFFLNAKEHQLVVVAAIRFYRPEIIITNAVTDRHPDHGRASSLVSTSVFLAGLPKIQTTRNGKEQESWKTKSVYHCIQDRYIEPDFVIDVTDEWEQKMKSVLAYKSQFYNPNSGEPETPISTKEFIDFLKARAIDMGRQAGLHLAEGFTVERTPAISSLTDLK